MGSKKIDYRKVSRFYSYAVKDIVQLLDVHPNTVHNWIRSGLRPIDAKQPIMLYGAELKRFLKARPSTAGVKLRDNQFNCFRCKKPREACSESLVVKRPGDGGSYSLRGNCDKCGCAVVKKISLKQFRRMNSSQKSGAVESGSESQLDLLNLKE